MSAAPPPIPIPAACPALTGTSPGAWCRCHTCSHPTRLEPSSRKSSCSPWIPAGCQRLLLTRVGRSRGRGVPCQGSPSGQGGPIPENSPYLRPGRPDAPAGRAGRAARAGTAAPCSAPGRAGSAVARWGLPGGNGAGSACCRLPGEERSRARGHALHRESPREGDPRAPEWPGEGDPHTQRSLTRGNPAHREPPRIALLQVRLRSRPHRRAPTLARPAAAAPHTGSTAPRPHSPLARQSCKQRDGDERGPVRHPHSLFPFPRSHCPGAHEVGGNPRAGHGRTGGRRQQQQRGGGEESDGAHRAAHGRVP